MAARPLAHANDSVFVGSMEDGPVDSRNGKVNCRYEMSHNDNNFTHFYLSLTCY